MKILNLQKKPQTEEKYEGFCEDRNNNTALCDVQVFNVNAMNSYSDISNYVINKSFSNSNNSNGNSSNIVNNDNLPDKFAGELFNNSDTIDHNKLANKIASEFINKLNCNIGCNNKDAFDDDNYIDNTIRVANIGRKILCANLNDNKIK